MIGLVEIAQFSILALVLVAWYLADRLLRKKYRRKTGHGRTPEA